MNITTTNTYNSFGMPAQKISTSQKNEMWKRSCVDAILGMSNSSMKNSRTSKQNKQINYDLYNSKFHEEDFDYVTKPYGLTEKFNTATKMQNYNIIRPNIEVLKGEEIKRPFNFFAKAVNGASVTAKEQRKRELITQNLKATLFAELGITEEEGDEPMTLPQIEKYINTEFIDPREVTANQLLKYLLHEQMLEMKFNQGWEHALISAEEYYYVGIVSGEPVCRVVNPLDFEHDTSGDIKFIHDAQWAKEVRYLSQSSILDIYGEFLSDSELDRLDNGDLSYSSSTGMQPGFAYEQEDLKQYSTDSSYRQQGIVVTNVCWKSWKKIGFVRVINPQTGEELEQMVEDDYKLPNELKQYGATLEWRWINEVWEGTRIGANLYVNIRPLVNQTRNMSNPSECRLPYVGYIYNSTNSEATSILDLIKPHQYTYNIAWWRVEQEFAKAKGKGMVMDIAQLPKTQGMDVEQWMYYLDNLGVAFINSMEEGRDGDPNSVAKFNQFSNLDRTISQSVSVYFEWIREIKQMVNDIVGISDQRRAQTSPSESATANQNSIIQSSHMTEPYFYFHNILKGQVLTKLLECCKFAYEDGKKIQHIVDEVYSEIINVDGTFPDSDYGVYVTNSSKDNEIKQKLEALFPIAMQQEKVKLSDLVKGMQSDSVTEIGSIIAKGESDFYAQQAEQQQADRENQSAMNDKQLEDKQAARADDNMNKQLDRENKIAVATLNTLRGKDGPSDLNANGIPDAVEQGKLMAQVEADRSKQMLEQQKIASQAMKDAEANERAKEKNQADIMKSQMEGMKFEREQNQQDALNAQKAKVEAMKLTLAQTKLQAELKDKAEARKLKMKELEAKERIEKLKIKSKPKPKSK